MIIHYITDRNIFAFIAQYRKILKSHVNDFVKTNGKQMIKMPKKGEYVRFKN